MNLSFLECRDKFYSGYCWSLGCQPFPFHSLFSSIYFLQTGGKEWSRTKETVCEFQTIARDSKENSGEADQIRFNQKRQPNRVVTGQRLSSKGTDRIVISICFLIRSTLTINKSERGTTKIRFARLSYLYVVRELIQQLESLKRQLRLIVSK